MASGAALGRTRTLSRSWELLIRLDRLELPDLRVASGGRHTTRIGSVRHFLRERVQSLTAPRPASAQISAQMSTMPRASTKPEVRLRSELHRRGVRFRVHRKDLPGTPDIVLPAAKLAVFLDGCFWHSCPEHGTIPKSNNDWWKEKFEANRRRDQRKDDELRAIGWDPVHVWEHEDPCGAAARIVELNLQRRAG